MEINLFWPYLGDISHMEVSKAQRLRVNSQASAMRKNRFGRARQDPSEMMGDRYTKSSRLSSLVETYKSQSLLVFEDELPEPPNIKNEATKQHASPTK